MNKSPQKRKFNQNNQQLQKIYSKLLKENVACSKFFVEILGIINTFRVQQSINSNTIGILINKLCQTLLSLDINQADNQSKISKIKQVCNTLAEYYAKIQLQHEESAKKIKQCEKQMCSKLMHLILHFSSGRHIPKIVILFTILVQAGLLKKKTINFILLALIIGYESVNITSDVKLVQQALKIIYNKLSRNNIQNPFFLIAYFLYISKITSSDNIKIIQELFQCPYKITSIILNFRYEFSRDQDQNNVLECDRKFQSLSLLIVDNLVIRTLTTIFLDTHYESIKQKIFLILLKLIRYDLSILIVKNLIRKLQISSGMNSILAHWSQIFSIFQMVLPNSKFNHESILFTSKQAYLHVPLSTQIARIDFKFRSYRLQKQLILCKLYSSNNVVKGKYNPKNEIWITVRYVEMQSFLISILTISDKSVVKMEKAEIKFNQFQDNCLIIETEGNSIKILAEGINQLAFTLYIQDLQLKCLSIGDDNNEIGSYPCEVSQLILTKKNRQRFDKIQMFRKHTQKLQQRGRLLKLTLKKSIVYLLKIMGDLQLIMLIVSHIIRKVQDDKSLFLMLQKTMNLLGALAQAKGVVGVELSPQDREKRVYNVSCLSWLACKHKRKAQAILQLLRFLNMRQNIKEKDHLEVLCNFVLFKDMKYSDFKLIIDKIACDLKSLKKKESDYSVATVYCKRMILDLIIFFKNTQFLAQNLQEQALKKHCMILKTVYYHIIDAPKETIIVSFIFFLLKILFLLIDRRRQSDYIDTTMGFQIANLGLKLSKYVYQKFGQQNWSKLQQDKLDKQSSEATTTERQETLNWIKQINYCLQNQILYDVDARIKYFSWQSAEPDQDFTFMRENEIQLIKICQKVQVYLISSDSQQLRRLLPQTLSQDQINYFWQINLLEGQFKQINNFGGKLNFILKYGPYNSQTYIRSVSIIKKIIQKSFDFVLMKQSFKLPRQFIESFRFNNIQNCLNFLLGIYHKKIKIQQSKEKNKMILGQNLLHLIYCLPEALFSNSQEIRSEIRKNPKLKNTLQLTEMHLVIKQLSTWATQMLKDNDNTFLQCDRLQFFRKISQQSSSIQYSEQQELQKADEKQNLSMPSMKKDFIKCSLEKIQLLANALEMKKFYKIQGESKQVSQQIKELSQNFCINIQNLVQIFQISEIDTEERIKKFKSQIFFLNKHVYKFSCMIMDQYVFQQIKTEQKFRPNRKKSLAVQRGQKLRQQSENMLKQYFLERRKSIFKIEKLWSTVEKNNKYFWQLFFVQQSKHQSLDNICNNLKMRSLIKIDNQKQQIQLPKAIVNKSIMISISASSDKDLTNQGQSDGSIFSDNIMYEPGSSQSQTIKPSATAMLHQSMRIKKQKKKNQFSVLWVTNAKIYQGVLMAQKYSILFFEEEPDQNFYQLVCANQHQRRTQIQIQKQRYNFTINLNKKSSITIKRYLNHEAAVQIYSDMKCYLICFRKSSNRQKFLRLYENLKCTFIGSDYKVIQTARQYAKKWINGDISNFTYLMHLNDLGSRSFNDLSQYYIFPWVVTNFKAKKIDNQFLNNPSNFRDLSKPVGALNQERLKVILDKYQESQKYQETQSYLYGSFYSNPAIVCNYLVRLQPFALHHYLLQKHQFDLADRLFYSISNQFQGCYENIGDYKQLIPQFFYLPEFLKNRSKYDFGYRHNKQLVHNVELPQWAKIDDSQWQKGQAPSVDKFIFEMRKILESSYVTKNLHKWIDLIFGVYSRQDRAIQKNNLFIQTTYKDQLGSNKLKKDKELSLLMYKQFGQAPRQLFEKQHQQSLVQSQIAISKFQPIKINAKFQLYLTSSSQIIIEQQQVCWISEEGKIHIANVSSNLDKYEEVYADSFSQKQKVYLSRAVRNLRRIKCLISESKQVNFYFYLKSDSLVFRQISYNPLRRRTQLREEQMVQIPTVVNCNIVQTHQDFNILIIAQNQTIKLYKYKIETRQERLIGSKRNSLILEKKNEFTQHRSQIVFIQLCLSSGLLLSLDLNHKIYVLKLSRDEISVIQSFKLKRLGLCQSVINMKIHEMGYIIILTSQHLIHVYNFLGDYISRFDLQVLGQCSLKNKQTETVTTFEIWNHESAQLVVGTNFGNLYFVNFFQSDSYEMVSVSREELQFIHIKRIGCHWQCIVADRKNIFKLQSQKYLKAYKRHH